jgi:spermidine synthase
LSSLRSSQASESILPLPTPGNASEDVTPYLQVAVFSAGLCVMAAEMAAPRLLAPAFGTTQLIWTNIIGTVLAALTAGAFVGGRLGDRWPNERAFARVLLLAGLGIACIPLLSRPLLPVASSALLEQRAGSFLGALGVICLLFAPPVFLLGMASPWAIRIAGIGREDLGRVAGILSGLAALGSILGTFLSSLVAIPLLGTRATLFAVAAALLLLGAWGSGSRWMRGTGAGVALVLLAWPAGPVRTTRGQLYEAESFYQYVEVVRDRAGWTQLVLNEGIGVQSLRPPAGALTRGVWDALSVLPAMATRERDPLRFLLLGLAGGTVAQQIDRFYRGRPALRIDGVELDPEVLKAGRRFFSLDSIESLHVHAADGRTFLRASRGPYDLIVSDAYQGFYVPFQMTTVEFYSSARDRLTPGGIFAVNVAAPPEATELLDSFAATLRIVFPHVARFELRNPGMPFWNFVFLASRAPLAPPNAAQVPTPLAREALPAIRATWRVPEPGAKAWVLRDDRAPVEFLTDRALLRLIAR